MARRTASRSQTSPSMMGVSSVAARWPADRLSKMTTRCPARRSALALWLPIYPAPPVARITLWSCAANGVIRESVLLHLLRRVDVPPVEHHRGTHQLSHPCKIRTAEFIPFG